MSFLTWFQSPETWIMLCKSLRASISFSSNRLMKRLSFVVFIVATWCWIKPLKSNYSYDVIKVSKFDDFLLNPDLYHSETVVELDANASTKHNNISQVFKLIIVSSLRSGSSFLGQLFNQNPSAFYFFEPLFPLHDSCQIDQNEKVDIFSSIFMCDLRASKKYIDKNIKDSFRMIKEGIQNKLHVQRRLHNLKKASELSMCFPSNSKALCKTPSCVNNTICSNCIGKLKRPEIEKHCNTSHLVVVKTVRTCRLSLLKRVQKKIKKRLKVIHLVRDPRAVALSRLEMHNFTGNVAKEMERSCQTDLGLYEEKNQADADEWNDEDYMVVRYEYLILDPVGFLKQAARRMNMKSKDFDLLHPDVMDWITNNTRSSTGNRYSTSRNSLEQISKWRNTIPMKLVLDVQRACKNMMRLFGYLPIDSIADLRNTSLAAASSNDDFSNIF